ncbi:TcpE family conjugal transfer membrane protein [Spirillospora sp. NPDC052242]
MDLPTYTNIWRIEKRLYKLYDLRLPMPLPLVQIGVFLGVFVPWIVMLQLVGVPFESPWHVIYIVPPGVLTWLATRPVIEGKRLTELLLSQGRYLAEPRTWCRLTPIREPREVVIVARVWRRPGAPAPAPERVAVKSRRRPAPAAEAPATPEVPAPRLEVPPATPRLEGAPGNGKRGLVSGVRRPGAPGFATAMAPAEEPRPSPPQAPAAAQAGPAPGETSAAAPGGEPGDKKVAGPVPTRPDIPMVPGAFGAPEPLVNEAQPRHPGTPAPQPPDRRVAPAPERPRPPQGERPDTADTMPVRSPQARPPAPAAPQAQPPAPVRPSAPPQTHPSDPAWPTEPARPAAAEQRVAPGTQAPESERPTAQPPQEGVPAAGRSRPAEAAPGPAAPVRPAVPPQSERAATGQHPTAPQEQAPAPGRPAAPQASSAPSDEPPSQSGPPEPVRPAAAEQRVAPGAQVPQPARPAAQAQTPQEDAPVAGRPAEAAPETRPVAQAGGQAPQEDTPVAGRPGLAETVPEHASSEQPSAPVPPAVPPQEQASAPGRSAASQASSAPSDEPSPQGRPPEPVRPAASEQWVAPGAQVPESERPAAQAPQDDAPDVGRSRPAGAVPERASSEQPSAPVPARSESPDAAGEHRQPGASQEQSAAPTRPVPQAEPGQPAAASAGESAPVRPAAFGEARRTRPEPVPDERGGGVPPAPRTFGRAPVPEDVQDGAGRAPAPGHQVPAASQQGWPPAPEPEEAEAPRLEAPRPWSKGLSKPARPAATDAQMWPPVPEPGVPQDEEPPPRDVRSGPQSPVRPRPLPPPPAPPPSGPAITPPGPEHEVSAGGLRRLFQAVGGGHGDVDAEYQLRLQQPFRGTRHVVVLGCTGGAGQTVTALMLGHTFAQHNAEPVVAIDVNPGPGALARRTRSETNETLTGLITRADQVGSLTAMRRYTSQAKSGLDVIAAGKNPLQALDDRDYALAIRTIDRFYSVTLLDTAAAVVARVLPYADQLVLVAPASADAPRAVAMTYEWLDGHGYEELRSRAVTVINGVSRRSMDDVEQAEAVARGRCRALVRIPWDDHLSMDRAPRNELKSLRAPTRRAYLALAGVVAGGFGVVPERYQELHQEQEATR